MSWDGSKRVIGVIISHTFVIFILLHCAGVHWIIHIFATKHLTHTLYYSVNVEKNLNTSL